MDGDSDDTTDQGNARENICANLPQTRDEGDDNEAQKKKCGIDFLVIDRSRQVRSRGGFALQTLDFKDTEQSNTEVSDRGKIQKHCEIRSPFTVRYALMR
eukprot:TRINITY_DN13440_c1_g3_i1.p3 TRINITY_DN13440_c1_g3~~TRINITY_DN13440_c1_g3_i1.p3  ORF type:complete len:100 (+),score=14.89 TRINITY_DN13440_c1_g3_i1:3915-4214(+)